MLQYFSLLASIPHKSRKRRIDNALCQHTMLIHNQAIGKHKPLGCTRDSFPTAERDSQNVQQAYKQVKTPHQKNSSKQHKSKIGINS